MFHVEHFQKVNFMQEITVLDGLFKILFAIYQTPTMYLRRKSIFQLEIFIQGIRYGVVLDCQQNQRLKQELEILHQFDLFLRQKYFYGASLNCYSALYCHSGGSEEIAFGLFFEELKIYLNQNTMSI